MISYPENRKRNRIVIIGGNRPAIGSIFQTLMCIIDGILSIIMPAGYLQSIPVVHFTIDRPSIWHLEHNFRTAFMHQYRYT